MCIYTVKKQKKKIKNLKVPQGGCATPPEHPEVRRLRHKRYRKN